MLESVTDLLKSFPNSFLNAHGEVILHKRANEYFNLATCNGDFEIKCKVLEWLSRGACKTQIYSQNKRNKEFNSFMLSGINSYLKTSFSEEDMRKIYQELGNQINRKLTIDFINSGYNLKILEVKEFAKQ